MRILLHEKVTNYFQSLSHDDVDKRAVYEEKHFQMQQVLTAHKGIKQVQIMLRMLQSGTQKKLRGRHL